MIDLFVCTEELLEIAGEHGKEHPMSNYVHSSRMSYNDYLQVRSFEDSFKATLSKQTRSIIASNEELAEAQIYTSKELSTEVASGFEEMSFHLERIAGGISRT